VPKTNKKTNQYIVFLSAKNKGASKSIGIINHSFDKRNLNDIKGFELVIEVINKHEI
jgi:hypothetical protein